METEITFSCRFQVLVVDVFESMSGSWEIWAVFENISGSLKKTSGTYACGYTRTHTEKLGPPKAS